MAFIALMVQPRISHAEQASLVVGWTPVPGLMERDADGHLTGFMIDLARMVAQEAHLTLRLEQYDTVPELLVAQDQGRSEMLAGVADLPSLRGSSHYTQNVGRVAITMLHRKGDDRFRDIALSGGLRLAGVRGAGGTELTGPLLRNDFFTFGSVNRAIEAVLSAEVDGLVGPEDALGAIIRAGGLEDRAALLDVPFRHLPRLVALHRGRPDLRTQIDAAVAALESDGRLSDLREKWGITPPPVLPKTLIAGAYHQPPYVIVQEDGTITGFAVEALNDIAGRAGQEVRFVPITLEELRKGPGEGRYDLLPLVPINATRTDTLEFGLPLLSASYSVFVRTADRVSPPEPVDLAGKRVGLLALDHGLVSELGGAETVLFGTMPEMVSALSHGGIDALLADRLVLRHMLRDLGIGSGIDEAGPPLFEIEQAVALRPGLRPVTEVLNAATPGYVASPRYHELRTARIRPPTAWTSEQLARMLGALGAMSVLTMGYVVWQHYMRRLSDARRDIAEDLIDKIPLGLLLLSRDGRIKYINRETARTGASRSGLLSVGKYYADALRGLIAAGRADLGGADPEKWIADQIKDVQADGREVEVRTASGTTFIRTTKRLKGGETLLLRRDVTEERARLHQIQLLNDDLRDQIRIANATTEDLRAFAYATSHDLKAPTNTARMIATALREDLAEVDMPETQELLTDLETTLDGMQTLIEDVRAYTDAIAAQKAALPVDIGAEARAALEELSEGIRACGATVTLGTLPEVIGSSGQIRILFCNLIDNAIKFRSPDRGLAVSISQVDAPAGAVAVAVCDNGIGIDPAHHARIFQLFQRLNPVTDYGGSGLGLSICQRIAINHGGQVTVDSVPGRGSTFTVYLRKDTE
ncbi:ATP-binding protein [Antarctobacter jejuensis]|uniref:ATP-binding protein n=1 Tax=Antarctobacter jejuensis TaxID=1439938 RepID=UPI003FD65CBD